MELPRGTPIGPYRIDALIARGGMGAVYRARRADGAVVALKLLQADLSRPDRRARFEREAELTARLAHPSVVRVHGAGVVGPLNYLVMDFVDGEPLSASCGRIAPQVALRAVAEVARGIEHAHERGVLHRDIKPSNVLVRRDDGRSLITDFGIARAMDSGSSLTKTGAMVGTPFYMAPEQITGEPVTTATDVHGLGLLLYEALTGVCPFQRGELAGVCHAVTEHVPAAPSSLRPGVSRSVDRLCAAALAKDPARRPSAGDFAAGLEAALAEPDAPARWRPRAALALLLALACAGGGLLVASQLLSARRPVDETPGSTAAVVATSEPVQRVAPEPRWVRPLGVEGSLALLRAAEEDTRGPLAAELSPATREAVLKATERLARRWQNPVPKEAGFLDEEQRAEVRLQGERLILIQALRRRLDPGSEVPDEVGSLLRMAGIVGGLPTDSKNFAHALVEVMPNDLPAHSVYCSTLRLDSDERVLRRGMALADAAEDGDTWRSLAGMLADKLNTAAHDRDPARARAARAELDALVEDGVAHADRTTEAAWTVLKVAARLAQEDRRWDDALRHWDRALPFFKDRWDGHSFRAGAAAEIFFVTRDPDHAEVAIADLEALLRYAEADPAACESVFSVIGSVVRVLAALARHEEGLAAVERLLAVAPPVVSADLSLSRVVSVARSGLADQVPPALEHLARCVDARRAKIEAVLTAADRQAIEGLQRTIRAGLGEGASLSALADALERHPARRYLSFEFAPY